MTQFIYDFLLRQIDKFYGLLFDQVDKYTLTMYTTMMGIAVSGTMTVIFLKIDPENIIIFYLLASGIALLVYFSYPIGEVIATIQYSISRFLRRRKKNRPTLYLEPRGLHDGGEPVHHEKAMKFSRCANYAWELCITGMFLCALLYSCSYILETVETSRNPSVKFIAITPAVLAFYGVVYIYRILKAKIDIWDNPQSIVRIYGVSVVTKIALATYILTFFSSAYDISAMVADHLYPETIPARSVGVPM